MLTAVNLIFSLLDLSAVILPLSLGNVNCSLLVYYMLLTLTDAGRAFGVSADGHGHAGRPGVSGDVCPPPE